MGSWLVAVILSRFRQLFHEYTEYSSFICLFVYSYSFQWWLYTYDIESLPEPPFLVRLIAVVKVMHYTNSGLNPLVYSCRNPEMRRTMTSIVKKWLPSTPQSSTPWRRPRNDVVVKVWKVKVCKSLGNLTLIKDISCKLCYWMIMNAIWNSWDTKRRGHRSPSVNTDYAMKLIYITDWVKH